jgi:hypothetical protein
VFPEYTRMFPFISLSEPLRGTVASLSNSPSVKVCKGYESTTPYFVAVLLPSWLVAGFPQRSPGFDPRSSHVGFMVDRVRPITVAALSKA